MIYEERFIFSPVRFPEGQWDPLQIPFAFEDVDFYTDDGVRLHGWLIPHENPEAHVLYCHGNAGNLTHRISAVEKFRQELKATVFIFDYRGFGRSEGTPTQRGLYHDAYAARDKFFELCKLKPEELLLFGRSIGAALALDLGIDRTPKGLVLESAFTSLSQLPSFRIPLIPLHWLIRSRFETVEKIKQYHGPLIINHCDRSGMVPIEHAQRLYLAATRAKPKYLCTDPSRFFSLLNEEVLFRV